MGFAQVRACRDYFTFCLYIAYSHRKSFLEYLVVTIRRGYTRSHSLIKILHRCNTDWCNWLEMLSHKLCPFGYKTNNTPHHSGPKTPHLQNGVISRITGTLPNQLHKIHLKFSLSEGWLEKVQRKQLTFLSNV